MLFKRMIPKLITESENLIENAENFYMNPIKFDYEILMQRLIWNWFYVPYPDEEQNDRARACIVVSDIQLFDLMLQIFNINIDDADNNLYLI